MSGCVVFENTVSGSTRVETALAANAKVKALQRKDFFGHTFPEETPAMSTVRHNAVKTMKRRTPFFIPGDNNPFNTPKSTIFTKSSETIFARGKGIVL